MAFNFGVPTTKVATGFTLPTSSIPATTASQLNFGAASGDSVQSKPLFGSQAISTASTPFAFGNTNSASATTTASVTSTTLSFSLNALGTTTALTSSFAAPVTTTSIGGGFSLGTPFSLGTTTTTPSTTSSLGFALLGATTKPAATISGVSSAPLLATSIPLPTASGLTTTGTLTYAQLEDTINKWTVDLEEQGKMFSNQAKHLNAWDRLLIGNGEKILTVRSGIERVKHQQQKLDQDLDFILAQQNELEDCIAPLEKELQEVPIADTERDQTYKLAGNIDSQLKQMSEDLKEIIEHLNESNKAQELSDPVAQIGRILNAHMNSLQWIDRSTSQISARLDDISKINEKEKKKADALARQNYNF